MNRHSLRKSNTACQFTFDGDCGLDGAEYKSYYPLTTPIAYISSVPSDSFSALEPKFENMQTIKKGLKPMFEYTSRVSFGPNGTSQCINSTAVYNMLGAYGIEYIMTSLGPDADQDYPWGTDGAQGLRDHKAGFIYEPSNGLTSNGNIFVLNSQIMGGTLIAVESKGFRAPPAREGEFLFESEQFNLLYFFNYPQAYPLEKKAFHPLD